MAEVHARKLVSALTRKGFEEQKSHHRMFFFMVAGKRTSIRTRLSHGQTKIDNWLLGEIAKQVHLSKQDLNQFIECEMTQEAYLRKMIDDGHVRLDDPPVKTIRR